MRSTLESLWAEPAVENPPARVNRDWYLVAFFVVSTITEGILRPDLTFWPVSIFVVLGLTTTLLWRRTRPLAMLSITFGIVLVMDQLANLVGDSPVEYYSGALVLILIYAVFRWGSGREAFIGLAVCLVVFGADLITSWPGPADAIGGFIILLFPAELGAAIRYQGTARRQQIEKVRSSEREQLARELHDTVAHHVSAIAVQAQAGRFLANSSDAKGAADALEIIEEAASRTLAEMRSMVEVLRDDETPVDLVPQRGVRDITLLAETTAAPKVHVSLTGDLTDLRPSVDAALYRLAQESITNAVRHARRATRVDVGVHGTSNVVQLTVDDNGEPASGIHAPGYGIIGMTERASLLGGTIQTGPRSDRGWSVRAELPRNGSTS